MTTRPRGSTPAVPHPVLAFLFQLRAFLLRDLRADMSYRFPFLWQFGAPVLTVLTLHFLARLVGPAVPRRLGLGVDYFAFALVGSATLSMLNRTMGAFALAVRHGQVAGTLEGMLLTRAGPVRGVVLSGAYRVVLGVVHWVLQVLLGALLGARFEPAGILPVLGALVLTLAAFVGLGCLGAAGVLLLRRVEPVTSVVGGVAGLLGGVLYPVAILPAPLAALAQTLPITPALTLLRGVLLPGGERNLAGAAAHLALFALLLPLGLAAIALAIRRCRTAGTIGNY